MNVTVVGEQRYCEVCVWSSDSWGAEFSPFPGARERYHLAVPQSWTLVNAGKHGVALRDGFNRTYLPEQVLELARANAAGGPGPRVLSTATVAL